MSKHVVVILTYIFIVVLTEISMLFIINLMIFTQRDEFYQNKIPKYYIAYSVICSPKQALFLASTRLYWSYGNSSNRITPPHIPRAAALLLRYIPLQTFTQMLVAMKTRHTECPKRNMPDFGRVFLMLKYTDITQNTYIQTWTVMEIMASEVWNFDSCYTLIDYQIHIKTGRNMWFL